MNIGHRLCTVHDRADRAFEQARFFLAQVAQQGCDSEFASEVLSFIPYSFSDDKAYSQLPWAAGVAIEL